MQKRITTENQQNVETEALSQHTEATKKEKFSVTNSIHSGQFFQ